MASNDSIIFLLKMTTNCNFWLNKPSSPKQRLDLLLTLAQI